MRHTITDFFFFIIISLLKNKDYQLTFTCSKSTLESLAKYVKYVRS